MIAIYLQMFGKVLNNFMHFGRKEAYPLDYYQEAIKLDGFLIFKHPFPVWGISAEIEYFAQKDCSIRRVLHSASNFPIFHHFDLIATYMHSLQSLPSTFFGIYSCLLSFCQIQYKWGPASYHQSKVLMELKLHWISLYNCHISYTYNYNCNYSLDDYSFDSRTIKLLE